MISLNKKIHVSQAVVDHAGQSRKHLVVELRGDQQIADVLATPEAWLQIQQDGMKRLAKGDTVSVVSSDGLVVADSAMCIKAEAGNCWFSKPLRMVNFETVALYSDGRHEVVPVGTNYALRNIRDGSIDYSQLFPSAKAAEHEIERRKPIKAA